MICTSISVISIVENLDSLKQNWNLRSTLMMLILE